MRALELLMCKYRIKHCLSRAAIDIFKTSEETVNVNETNPMPVEKTETAKNTEK